MTEDHRWGHRRAVMSGPGGQKPEVRMSQGHAPEPGGRPALLLTSSRSGGSPWLSLAYRPFTTLSALLATWPLSCVSDTYKDRVVWS